MTKQQINWIIFLVGIFTLSICIYHKSLFFKQDWQVVILKGLVMTGLLLLLGSTARILHQPFWKGTLFLLLLEGVFYSSVAVVGHLPFPEPAIRVPDSIRKFLKALHNETHKNTAQYSLGRYDEKVGYMLKTGEGYFANGNFSHLYKINSLGTRDNDTATVHPKIVFIGDSFTMGWGVEQEEAFPQRVGKLLKIKTLNAGISSFGTAREALLINRLPLDSCRLLVLQYCHNDATENKIFKTDNFVYHPDRQVFEVTQCQNNFGKYFFSKYTFVLFEKMWTKAIAAFTATFKSTQQSIPNIIVSTETEDFMYALQKIRQLFNGKILVIQVDAIGIPTKIVEFKEAAEKKDLKNVVFLDVMTVLNLENDTFVYDDHINAKGHEKVARQIADYWMRNFK